MLIVIVVNNDDNELLLYKVVEEIFKKFKYIYISYNVYNIFCNDIFFIYNTIEKLQDNDIVLQYTVLFVIIKISKIYRN